MSIFKDSFRQYVQDQLNIRDEILDTGNPFGEQFAGGDGGPEEKYDRLKSRKVKLPSGKEITLSPGVFYNYTLNKQATLRMTSLTDYVEDIDLEIGDLQAGIAGAGVGFERLKGATLSQNFILEGGVLSDYARNLDRNGDGVSERIVRSVDRPRESFPKPGLKTNLGYGDFALGADANEDGFGIVPMPGIVDATIRTKSAYGSLREAKVNFVCHNRRQLEILEMLYMRPGYCVLLEWSWSPFVNNNGRVVSEVEYVESVTRGKIYTNDITQQEIYKAINLLKETSGGNYDGLLGFIKNFGFKARPDGGYDCYTELISMNEMLDSLKSPNVSIVESSLKFLPQDRISEDLSNAKKNGYFPTFNGLMGLIMGIYNYCMWEGFSGQERFGSSNSLLTYQYSQEFYKKYAPNLYDESGDLSDERNKVNDTFYDIDFARYQQQLLREEGGLMKDILLSKLGIKNEQLLDSFILREQSTNLVTYKGRHPEIHYIRWDALCILINNSLIPKDDKDLNVMNLVSDRIIYKDNRTPEIDPLLYAPITQQYNTNGGANILDFSCDPSICILPNQFDESSPTNRDKFGFEGGYPKLEYFPIEYIASIYGYSKVFYAGETEINFNDDNLQYDLLTSEHKHRRIGSIFLNVKMLLDIAEANQDNEDYTLGQYINDIWKKVNQACPNHNFVLTDDKEANTVYVVDLPVDNTMLPEIDDLYTFIPFSNKNTLREFNLESQVPNKLSATIAIRAQDPRNIEDIDGVTFAAFNRSIKNRLFSSDTLSESDKFTLNINNRLTDLATRHNIIINNIKKYSIEFFDNLYRKSEHKDINDINIAGMVKEFQKNEAYRQTITPSLRNTFTSVIPLSFNATLDGISGMVIGNIFKIQKDRLPKAYKNANIGFILFNEEQTITAGQDWTTRIGGKMIILNDTNNSKSVINGNLQNPFLWPEGLQGQYLDEETKINVVPPDERVSTTNLDETQRTVLEGVKDLRVGDNIYLKRIKLNNISYVNGTEVTGSIGYVFLRETPEINNEKYGIGIDTNLDIIDNSYGAFNSWDDYGLELGIIQDIEEIPYNNGYIALKPSAYSKYNFSSNYKIVFRPTKTSYSNNIEIYEKVPIEVIIDGNRTTQYYNIEVNDTTSIKEVWYQVKLSDEAKTKFYEGYVLRESSSPEVLDFITTNVSLNPFNEISEGWLRSDVVAYSAEETGKVEIF